MTKSPRRPAVSITCALAVIAAAALTGCQPIVTSRGNLVEDERLNRVAVGRSDRNEVVGALGSPTIVSDYQEDLWYYIGQRSERIAFFRGEVAERRILAIRFDQDGIVAAIDELDETAGTEVNFVNRTTPTAGRPLTFIEQILGNFGTL